MKENHEKIKKRVERISKLTQMEDNLTIKEGEIAKYTFKMASDVQPQPRPQPQKLEQPTRPTTTGPTVASYTKT